MGLILPTEEDIKLMENNFPFIYNENQTLYLDKVLYKKDYDWHIEFHDNFGYKYLSSYHHIQSAKSYVKELNKFFKRNPFTFHNINNFCKLNSIDLFIDGGNLPVSGIAREKLDFKNSSGEIIKVSWNEIQNNTERYKSNYEDILIERKKARSISKEDAIKNIYKTQKYLCRPLLSTDFLHKQEGRIGIKTIRKYWDTFEKMQIELGLEIIGSHATILTDDECLNEIKNICNKVYETENRTTIMYQDIKKYGTYYDARPYNEVCKKNGTTLSQYINSLGYELQKAGNGLNHIFEDGERVVSKYEFDFSNYLRNNGLVFNKDYFRDVKYKTLTTEYNGNMNCDYEIHFQGRIFYVELAGILGNVGHEKCYRENIPINSKSKEKYRLDLMKKKAIFEKENLEYYILLKSEMTEEIYQTILDKEKSEVA